MTQFKQNQQFSVGLFIMLYKVVLTFKIIKTIKCNHSREIYN